MANLKGRKRNLKTVRQLAQERQKNLKQPSWYKRIWNWVWLPIAYLFKWLNQPLAIHTPSPQTDRGIVAGLTKSRSILPAYLRNSFFELRQVVWPNFPTALRLTFAVIVFAIFFALIVLVFDWVLTRIFEEIILEEGRNIKEWF